MQMCAMREHVGKRRLGSSTISSHVNYFDTVGLLLYEPQHGASEEIARSSGRGGDGEALHCSIKNGHTARNLRPTDARRDGRSPNREFHRVCYMYDYRVS